MLSWWRERGSYNWKEKNITTRGNFTSLPLLFLNRFGSKLLLRVLWNLTNWSWWYLSLSKYHLQITPRFKGTPLRFCVYLWESVWVGIHTMLLRLLLNSMPVNRSLLEQLLPFHSLFARYAELFSWDCFLMFTSTSFCGLTWLFFLSCEMLKTASHPQTTSVRQSSKALLTKLSCTGWEDCGKVVLKSSAGAWGAGWLLPLWLLQMLS